MQQVPGRYYKSDEFDESWRLESGTMSTPVHNWPGEGVDESN
jgi:hypothetical protein